MAELHIRGLTDVRLDKRCKKKTLGWARVRGK